MKSCKEVWPFVAGLHTQILRKLSTPSLMEVLSMEDTTYCLLQGDNFYYCVKSMKLSLSLSLSLSF